jgi:hypothetical protein
MSLTTLGSEPQPTLAWTFESSNVDYVTNLSPSSQVSPGPAQLQGSAALVTTVAGVSNTAVYFPGTSGSYMGLGSSTPTNFDINSSNCFIETWVYLNTIASLQYIYSRRVAYNSTDEIGILFEGGGTNKFDFFIRTNSGYKDCRTSLTYTTTGVWYHIAASYDKDNNTAYIFVNGTISNSLLLSATPTYTSGYQTIIGHGWNPGNMYIRDLRVVQGGVVPTTSFTPGAAPFSYASPGYVAGMGTTVFTLLGQFVTYVPGKFGNGVQFLQGDSTGATARSYIAYNYTTGNNFTTCFWVNFASFNSANISTVLYLQTNYTSGTNGVILFCAQTNGGYMQVFGNGPLSSAINSSVLLAVNTWYHCAFSVNSSGTCTLYVNGVGTSGAIASSSLTSFQVGARSSLWGMNGLVDDLRIYNTALTAAQVQSIYTQGGAPASSFRVAPQPRLAWDFNGTVAPYIGTATGTVTGTVNYGTGRYGQSIIIKNDVTVNSTSNLVTWNPSFSVNPWTGQTICSWVKFIDLPNATNGSALFGFGDQAYGGLRMVVLPTSLYGNFYDSATTQIRTTSSYTYTISTGVWYHYSMTSFNGVTTIYFNGVPVGYGTFTTNSAMASTTIIGTASGIRPTSAEYDDLRIYDTAMSATQVQSIYRAQGMPSRGVQVKTQVPVASMIGQTFTPPNTAFSLPDTSTPGQITLTIAANNKTNQGQVFLTPSITGVSFSVIYRSNSDGGSPACLISAEGDCFQVGTAFGITQLSARKFLAGTGYTHATSSITSSGVIYYVTCVLQTNGHVFLYINGTLTASGTTDTVQLPNKMYSVLLGQSRFGSSCDITIWDFFVVNATLSASQVSSIYQNQLTNINYNPGNTINWVPTRATGTPLFSQLSASATSSAVGAFSLRAVNGTTAKAVQVRPVAAFPPVVMTSVAIGTGNQFTQTLTGYPFGGTGSYASNSSSTLSSNYSWRAFDGSDSLLRWVSASTYIVNTPYSGTASTTVGGTVYPGEWLQIQLPQAIVLSSYSIYPQSTNIPSIWNVFASNDGTTWTVVDQRGTAPTLGQFNNYTISGGPAAYSYYRIGCYQISLNTSFAIGELKLYGSNASWQTDFYADRLGNLLTAPVTGQTLANWLGGATGYVTTWYDQSGRGNHATQATAASQPIIQRATKGPGYMCLYSGTQGLTFGAYNLLNNTNYTTCGVVRRTAVPAGTNYYLSGNGGVNAQDQKFHSGYRTSTQLTLAHYSDDKNLSVPAFLTSTTEPTAYNYLMVGTGLSGRLYSYSSGTLYSDTRTYIGYLNQAIGSSFSIGGGFGNFTGEIYEILVFTQSLYDLDGTTSINKIYQNQLAYTGT